MSTKHPSFAERYGHQPPKSVQETDMDDDLRTGLWNIFCDYFENVLQNEIGGDFVDIWCEFSKLPSDEYYQTAVEYLELYLEMDGGSVRHFHTNHIKEIFFKGEWFDVYRFLEFMLSTKPKSHSKFIAECNKVLEKENSAYEIKKVDSIGYVYKKDSNQKLRMQWTKS